MTSTERFIVIPRERPDALRSLESSPVRPRARVAPTTDANPEFADCPVVGTRGKICRIGAEVVELSPHQAAALEERDDVHVLRDRPMRLPRVIQRSATSQLDARTRWHLEALDLPRARDEGRVGTGRGVVVAMMDTGVDSSHPEFDPRKLHGYTLAHDTIDSTGRPTDDHGHGTHVAGLLCGQKQGVAPDVDLWSLRVFEDELGKLSDFILALDWISQKPDVSIVNVSAGLPTSEMTEAELSAFETVLRTMADVGVLLVGAIGNDGPNETRVPAALRAGLGVGASTMDGRVASFSGSGSVQRGIDTVSTPDLVAPGRAVTSAILGGHYEAWDGTSMAAPLVSGLAALLLERHEDLTVRQLTDELIGRCAALAGEPPSRQGAGVPWAGPRR